MKNVEKKDFIEKARKVLIVLIVLWMITVFLLSNQNGNDSGSLSHKIALLLFKTEVIATKMEVVVRKGAHILEFAYGAILFYAYCLTYPNMDDKKRVIFSIGCTALYAATDEIHQLFVNARSGSILDFMIDIIGAGLGVGLLWFATRLAKGTEYEIRHPEDKSTEEIFQKTGKSNKETIFNKTAEISINDLKNKIEKGDEEDD